MPTANDIILNATRKLSVKASGDVLTALEAADGLALLISMLENWSIDGLLIYRIAQAQYSWGAGFASRTIGVGGNFNGVNPSDIEEGTYFRRQNGFDYGVNILRNRESYDSYTVKTTISTLVVGLFLDKDYPLGVLYAYPIPSEALTLFLNYKAPLQTFTALTDVLSMPPGYQWAIEHNLAVALAPSFEVPVPPDVRMIASESKRTLKRNNHRPITSRTDLAALTSSGGGYNVYTDSR